MRYFYEIGFAGEHEEPTWKGAAGVLAFCADGERIFHERSKLDHRYVEAEARAKFDARRELDGPTTCSFFLFPGKRPLHWVHVAVAAASLSCSAWGGRVMDNVLDFPGSSGTAGLPPKEDSSRPAIMITPANYEQEIDAMERHLIAADRNLYQRDGEIVQAGTIKTKNPDGTEPSYVAPVKVKETTLMEMSTSATTWLQRTEKGWKQVKAPRDHTRALLDRGPRLNLPVLSGIISTPLMFNDGRLLERRGYDEQSGLLFAETGETFQPVPLSPTVQELRQALDLFGGLLPEFVFAERAGVLHSPAF